MRIKVKPYVLSAVAALSALLAIAAPAHASGLSVRRLPMPLRANGQLLSVSCGAPSACTAVGLFDINYTDETRPLAERWNGRAWRVQSVPAPAAPHSRLSSVACSGPRFCLATGAEDQGGFVEVWQGHGWRLLAAPLAPGTQATDLTGVSCPASNDCVAVGVGTYRATGGSAMIALHWDGRSLTPEFVGSGQVAAQGNLGAVSCPTRSYCIAVGADYLHSLAMQWNGTSWTQRPLPGYADQNTSSYLDGISCVSSSWCIALGRWDNVDGASGVQLQFWNGSSWGFSAAPAPPGLSSGRGGTSEESIACVSTRYCEAGGNFQQPGGHPLVEQWDGVRWTLHGLPVPGPAPPLGPDERITGISCVAATCVAVGRWSSVLGGAYGAPVGQIWHQNVRRLVATPPTTTPGGTVRAVSCAAPGRCMAVGDTGAGDALAEVGVGRSWHLVAAVSGPVQRASLTEVSCPRVDWCMATGWHLVSLYGFNRMPFAERWNGHGWREVRSPSLGPGFQQVNGVSCSSPGSCYAAAVAIRGGYNRPILERWDGRRWHVLRGPVLARNEQDTALDGISCPSAQTCIATGDYKYLRHGTLHGNGFVARWHAGRWTILRRRFEVELGEAISCPTVSWCAFAVSEVVVEWDGAHWRRQSLPHAGRQTGGVATVSCPSVGVCGAAGGTDHEAPYMAVFAGGHWHARRGNDVRATDDDVLSGVSCPTLSSCTAVGNAGLLNQNVTTPTSFPPPGGLPFVAGL